MLRNFSNKATAVEPHAFLPVEDGTEPIQLDRERNDCHTGQCKNDKRAGDYQIDDTPHGIFRQHRV